MLRGKNAIVTGCNRGMGKAIATKLLENGANVWCCVRKENEEFERYIRECAERNNVWAKIVCFDLADSAAINEGIRSILKEKLPVDILVNNAGIMSSSRFLMTPVAEIKRVFEVNYFAPLQIMQLVSKAMVKQKSGSIINIGSVSGLKNDPGLIAYGGSKDALLWATKTVSRELGPYGIRVNAVAPGMIDTDMTRNHSDEVREALMGRTSLGRLGDAEDVANAVLFLASDMAKFVTGDTICVDGGRA